MHKILVCLLEEHSAAASTLPLELSCFSSRPVLYGKRLQQGVGWQADAMVPGPEICLNVCYASRGGGLQLRQLSNSTLLLGLASGSVGVAAGQPNLFCIGSS